MRTPDTSPASRPRSKRGRRRTMTAALSARAILKSTPPASEGARASTGRQPRREASPVEIGDADAETRKARDFGQREVGAREVSRIDDETIRERHQIVDMAP